MKNALSALVLISMVVVAVLVMKNMQGQSTDPSVGSPVEALDHAREAADEIEGDLDVLKDRIDEADPANE